MSAIGDAHTAGFGHERSFWVIHQPSARSSAIAAGGTLSKPGLLCAAHQSSISDSSGMAAFRDSEFTLQLQMRSSVPEIQCLERSCEKTVIRLSARSIGDPRTAMERRAAMASTQRA